MREALNIDRLVDGLTPVRRVRPGQGMMLGLALAATVAVAIVLWAGIRADIAAMRPLPIVVLRSGTLMLLGLATLKAVTAMVRPGIGNTQRGWAWMVAVALLFPLASVIGMIDEGRVPVEAMMNDAARDCLILSLSGALAIGTAMVLWLRRGAVVDPARAGWLTGLAAGAFGTLAYSLHCGENSVHYIALWYGTAVTISAVAGRLAVPPLIRW
ncbi:NrsF family protein [Sphingomonas sp. CJ99]